LKTKKVKFRGKMSKRGIKNKTKLMYKINLVKFSDNYIEKWNLAEEFGEFGAKRFCKNNYTGLKGNNGLTTESTWYKFTTKYGEGNYMTILHYGAHF
jgi:hypothetical protein